MSESVFGSEEGAEDRESSHDADVQAGFDSDQDDDAAGVVGGGLTSDLDGEQTTSHDADVDAGFDDADGTGDSGSNLTG